MIYSAQVMLLAAGLGTRLKPLTESCPKPCVPFLNVPMGLYQFQYFSSFNLTNLIVNTFHLPLKIRSLYEKQPYVNIEIKFSDESGQILGGAGGLKKAENLFNTNDPIIMLNADEVYFTQQKDFFHQALKSHNENKNLATLITIEHPEAGHKFGAIWTNEKNQVLDIGKITKRNNLKPWHFIGAVILAPEIFKMIPKNQESNILYDVLLPALETASVEIFPIKADWYETGNPIDYFKASDFILNTVNQDLIDFINQYDASYFIKNENTCSLISKKIDIDFSKLKGTNIISQTACIEKKMTIENMVIFENYFLNKKYFNC